MLYIGWFISKVYDYEQLLVTGCVDLLDTIRTRVKPKYHIFGHIHEGTVCCYYCTIHTYTFDGRTFGKITNLQTQLTI